MFFFNREMTQNIEISRTNLIDCIQRKHFIHLYLHKANKSFRSSRGLKLNVWPHISQELEKLFRWLYTPKQLKIGWDYMKRQYLA